MVRFLLLGIIFGELDVNNWEDIVFNIWQEITAVQQDKSRWFSSCCWVDTYGQINVSNWEDDNEEGEKDEDKVEEIDESNWKDIVDISAEVNIRGIKGRLWLLLLLYDIQIDVSGKILQIFLQESSYSWIKIRCSVTVVGYNNMDNMSAIGKILQLFSGSHHTVGLKSDGSVVAVGE